MIWSFPVRKNWATLCVVKGIRSEFNLTLSMFYVELNEGLRESKSNDQSKKKLIHDK